MVVQYSVEGVKRLCGRPVLCVAYKCTQIKITHLQTFLSTVTVKSFASKFNEQGALVEHLHEQVRALSNSQVNPKVFV